MLTTRFSIIFFLIIFSIKGQDKSFKVKFITEEITLDGVLDEKSWIEADSATDFYQYFPSDSILAEHQTIIKMLFDDENLYVGIKVNARGDDFIVPSLRRDFSARSGDNVTLMFDTFNDGTNAILFGTNPYGVRREMLLSGGGEDGDDFNDFWDTKWRAETKRYNDHYISEWIIPLAAFKYHTGESKWRFNTYQFDTQSNVQNAWIQIPQNQRIFSLAFMGDMIFEKPLGKSKSPISLIPYVNGLMGKDYVSDENLSEFQFGGDVKMTLANSLNLDLTINPDFSQVEVDQQVTNLTRFEVSLPERRQFFIENSDLFADFGDSRDANPFFSRRIGIARDSSGNNIENRIIAGARLSGKIDNNLRIGLLNVQTAEDKENNIPTTNNAVITAQYKMFNRSNLSFMFINRQPTGDLENILPDNQYNRVVGLDYRLASKDNSWQGKYYLHKSFSPDTDNNEWSAGITTEYNTANYTVKIGGLYIGENFRSDLGFIRRTDILKIDPRFNRRFWMDNNKRIANHSLTVMPVFIWRPSLDFENSDYSIFSEWQTRFTNNTRMEIKMKNEFIKLYESFDPTGSNLGTPLPGDTKYYFTSFSLSYNSDNRKAFSYRVEPSVGEFYNGKKYSLESSITYRLQPYFTSSMQLNYDNINLPNPYPDASIWLIGPKFDITFSKTIFWATFIQYSTQAENFSVNTRLQWRFAPLSDLFIVYNDNYLTHPRFLPRGRTLNLKLTYWLNI